jgi:hypothetical protein
MRKRDSVPRSVSFGLLFIPLAALALAGCPPPQNDYGTDGCSALGAPPVANFWAGPGVTDVTFLAFGDSQVYLDASLVEDDGGRKNDLHVQALNVADSLSWSALGVGQSVAHIRGVIMAGDITQNGRDARETPADEYRRFVDNYGLCGNRTLRFPMFEGYGNHDFRSWNNLLYGNEHPVADSVSVRNPFRVGLTRQAPGTQGHYSWDWDNVHFIHVNLVPSDQAPVVADAPAGCRDPREALTYLVNDLASVGTSRPVVIIHHYYPDASTFEWDQAQIDAYAAALSGYHVIAILYGHSHDTGNRTWKGIPIFNLGSPYYLSYNPDGRGHYSVFRITDDKLYAFDASWDPADPTSVQAPDNWSRTVDLP